MIGFAVTIGASFLSARWGSAETRKQFTKKIADDERAAAAELIPLLMRFAAECEDRKSKLSLHMSSDGQAGNDESMGGIPFPPGIHSSAARLGERITERAIKLELTKQRAESWVMGALDFLDTEEVNEKMLGFFALLSLRARYLADMAGERVGLKMRHAEEDLERLRKEAFKSQREIDSGDDTRW
ncbi:hypothetical protein [Bradyrhizobium sacchari]|nr:hypothetical protein [Bradyrhizobium sacchari]